MLARLIQSLFFLSICTTTHGMLPKGKQNFAIDHPTSSKNNKNNKNKMRQYGALDPRDNLTKSHPLPAVTPRAIPTQYRHPAQVIMPQPVINVNQNDYYPPVNYHPELNYLPETNYLPTTNYPQIFNYPLNFVQIDSIKYPTKITYLPYLKDYSHFQEEIAILAQFNYLPGFKYHPAVNRFPKTLEPNVLKKISCMPYDKGVLRSENQPMYRLLYEQFKEMALQGDTDKQIFIREILINKCKQPLTPPKFRLQTQAQEIANAYECLDFTNTLFKNNSFVLTPQSIKDAISVLMDEVSSPVAYILTNCQYLNAITDGEKQEILNTLMQKNNPDTLSAIAQNPLCSIIIEQLKRAPLTASNSYASDLNLAIAELCYYRGDLKEAHDYYSQNSAAYLKEKSGSLYPFATNAFNACLASTENFYKNVTRYLNALTPNIHNTVLAIEKTNPHISYGIGLLAQARIKNNPSMKDEKKIAVLLHGIDHLEYAQKSMPCAEAMALAAEFHTALSAIYAVKNDGAASLKHMHHALTYGAHINADQQNKELLAILAQNPELCTQHPQWLAKILNLICNPYTQQYDDLHKDYAALAQFAECDLAQQLLPYLGDAYRINKKNKPEIARLLALLHLHNGDYDKVCSYLNFLTHIDEKFMHYFLHTIASQKNMSQILQTIAKRPACTKIIDALRTITLADNNPLLSHRNLLLAELSYYSAKYENAHRSYAQLPKNKLSPIIKSNAFNACIASTEMFGKKETQYLSSLNNNINNQLKTIEKIEPKLSYHIGLFIQYLINNSAKLSAEEKMSLIVNGLNHLEYAQKNSSCLTTEKLHNLQALAIEFHTLLSNLYEAKNDVPASLKHLCNALAYTSPQNNCARNGEIATILAQAEEKTPELYKQYTSLLNTLVKFITKQPHNAQQKDYALLSQFASSDLCAQLLPYGEQAYDNTTEKNNIIICLMALAHKNNGDHTKACDLMDTLSQPTPTSALLYKAEVYMAAKKPLPDSELKAVFTLFINNKKPSIREQELIVLEISFNDFFVRTKNYTLALKLITKLAELDHAPSTTIKFAVYITEHLNQTENPYLKEWKKGLLASQLYNIKDPSAYDGETNASIGTLLLEKSQTDYEKIIAHFTAALDSNDLLPKKINTIDNACGALYCNWAVTVKHDKEKFLCLLDRAIIKHNNNLARYKKAFFILNTTDNAKMANHALELLEKIIASDSNTEVDSQLIVDSKIALVCAYFNHNPDPARIPIIQRLIPLNVPKAMSLFEAHDNNKKLLTILRTILTGNSIITMTPETKKELIDYAEALKLTDLLIKFYGITIDELAQRSFLYGQLNAPKKAIEDIDLMLNSHNLSNTDGVTREKLLAQKINYLLSDSPDDNSYDQALECFKQLEQCNEKIIVIDLTTLPKIHERIQYLIAHQRYAPNDIEWGCLAAKIHIAADDNVTQNLAATQEQKELAEYLFAAAKKDNIDAQLILPPYLNTINGLTHDRDSFVEILVYVHAALLNPSAAEKKYETSLLVNLLRQFVENGFALPYYILCDYCKNDSQKLEETMVLFSKAPIQNYYIKNRTDIIEKICLSCRDTLMTYINRYLNNEKKASKIDALAVFTLGSMYQYSNNNMILSAASFYLNAVKDQLIHKFKLPHFSPYINTLLINIYQKQAALADSPIVQLNLHRRGAQLGHLPSIHTIAEMWIQQQTDEKNDLEITADDFVLWLVKDIQEDNPSTPRSVELFQKYSAIEDKNKKNAPDKKQSVIKEDEAKPTKMISINERMEIITHHARENNMVKNVNHKETSQRYPAALQLHGEGKLEEALAMYQEAADKENHSSAKMMLAINSITGELSAKDYTLTEELLNHAFSYGLIVKSRHSKAKLFENIAVLNITLCCIQSLIKNPHPQPIRSYLLRKIKETLVKNGIIMAPLHELFEKITGIKLDSVPEWKMNEEICNDLLNLDTISKALAIPAIRTEVYSLMGIVNPADNNVVAAEKKLVSPKVLPSTEIVEIIKSYTSEKNMIKNKDYKEKSQLFFAGVAADQQGNTKGAIANFTQAINKENHSNAAISLAVLSLKDKDIIKNYARAEKLLKQALSYGLVPKSRTDKSKQFTNASFLSIFVLFISKLKMEPALEPIKEQLLSIIKTTFTHDGINKTDFCELFEIISGMTLPEWQMDEENQAHSILNGLDAVNTALDEKNIPVLKTEVNSLMNIINSADDKVVAAERKKVLSATEIMNTIIRYAHEKKIIKHEKYTEKSNFVKAGIMAENQGNSDEAVAHFKKAINKESHPNASMSVALYSLAEKDITKNCARAEELLKQALSYGLIIKSRTDKSKQFHNACFLNTFLIYTDTLITEPELEPIKQPLLSIIKTTLVRDSINSDFCALYEKITGKKLDSVLEWKTAEELNNTLSSSEVRSLRNELNKMCDSLQFEYQPYKETSHYFAEAQLAYRLEQIDFAVNLLRVCITQERHPLACLALAKHYIGNVKINYPVLDDLLDQSFVYSLEKNQFKTEAYLNELCDYFKKFLDKTHPPLMKKRFFSTIKNALKQNTMSNEDFCTILLKKTNLNLALDPDWNTNNNKQPIPIIFSSGNISEDMELLKALTGSNSYSSTKTTATTATTTPTIKKSWIKNENYKEECKAFIFGLQAHDRGQKDIALGLIKSAAEKDHHPGACMFLAAHYIGADKDYKTSEHFLRQGLLYGLEENQFCNQEFLKSLSIYTKCVVTAIDSSLIKQPLLSAIKTALIKNNIDPEFRKFFHETNNIDLSLIPEWQTESESKPTETSILKKPLISTEYKETCQPFYSGHQAYKQGNLAIGAGFMKTAAEEHNHPAACLFHAFNLLLGCGINRDYTVSEEFFQRGLEFGIKNNQLCNHDFFGFLCQYITALIQNDLPLEIKQRFLSRIRRTLESKINMEDFYKAFQEKIPKDIPINLSLVPEWQTESEYKPTASMLKKSLTSLIKDTEYKETCQPYLLGKQAYSKGDVAKGDELIKIAAEKYNHSISCICHAFNSLSGFTPKNYTDSEKFLQRALELGIENNQLCNYDFVTFLCHYIIVLIVKDHPLNIKQRLLSTIRRTFESKGINMEDFYFTFHAAAFANNTSINLPSIPEWNN